MVLKFGRIPHLGVLFVDVNFPISSTEIRLSLYFLISSVVLLNYIILDVFYSV